MKRFTTTFLFFILVGVSISQEEPTRKQHYNIDKKGVAISGFDPTSYFKNNPTKGDKNIQHTYKGLTYFFANESNKAVFMKSPKKYEPKYGGWCAYAMGLEKPEKVSVNPKTYKLVDGELYLFYNKLGINTLNKWNENEKLYKDRANESWKTITDK